MVVKKGWGLGISPSYIKSLYAVMCTRKLIFFLQSLLKYNEILFINI